MPAKTKTMTKMTTGDRPLNWFGWSIETIAAVYESDAAAREAQTAWDNRSAQDYWQSAWRAEVIETQLDKASVE